MKILYIGVIFGAVIVVLVSVAVLQMPSSDTLSVKPNLISKQQAIDVAAKGFHCTRDYYHLNTATINGQLFHIQNNSVFFVDDKSVQDLSMASNFLSHEILSNGYVWEFTWDCYDSTSIGEPYHDADTERHVSFVDATSGVLLK